MVKVSSNTIIKNEIKYIDGLVANLIAANVDEILVLDGALLMGLMKNF